MEDQKSNTNVDVDDIVKLITTAIGQPAKELKEEIKNLATVIENKKMIQVRTIKEGKIVTISKLV